MMHSEQLYTCTIKLNTQFFESIGKHLVSLPTVCGNNGELLIDLKRVRDVKLVKGADGRLYFFCTIDNVFHILNFSEDLKSWFTISGISILEIDDSLLGINARDVINIPETNNPKRRLKR